MSCRDIQPSDEQILVCDPVKEFTGGIHNPLCGRCVPPQIDCAVGMLRYLAPIMVFYYIAVILFPALRVGQVLNVIAYRDNELVGDKALAHQIH